MIFVHFQGKPFNITVIQVYAPNTDFEEAEVDQFYEYLQGPVKPHTHTHTHTKDVFFITGDCNAKVGSQETPGMTESLALQYKILTEFCQENMLFKEKFFLQHMKQCYTWTWSTGGGNSNPLQYVGHKDITRWSISKSD